MSELNVIERWEIIYDVLKNKYKDGRHFADPDHVRNGFIALYEALKDADAEIEELHANEIGERYLKEASEKREDGLRKFVSMFTLDSLNGMFNHYMEMQKQAWHNQSSESVRNFWHERTKKQQEIIDAFKALKETAGETNKDPAT